MAKSICLLSILLIVACGHDYSKDYRYEVRVGTSDRHDALFSNNEPTMVDQHHVCVSDAHIELLVEDSFYAKSYCTSDANDKYQIQVIDHGPR